MHAPRRSQFRAAIQWGMSLSTRLSVALFLCIVVAGSVFATDENTTHPAAIPHVTTDTVEYCHTLRDRVLVMIRQAQSPPANEVFDLSIQGQRMCDQGHPRHGIQRLRRALMMLKQQQAAQ